MEAVTNVKNDQKNKFFYILLILFKENPEDFYNDLYTYRVTNLENALHSVGFNKQKKK